MRNFVVGSAVTLHQGMPDSDLWSPVFAATDLTFGSEPIYVSKHLPSDAFYVVDDRILREATWSFEPQAPPDWEQTMWFIEKIMMMAKLRDDLRDHLNKLVADVERRWFG